MKKKQEIQHRRPMYKKGRRGKKIDISREDIEQAMLIYLKDGGEITKLPSTE